MVPLRERSFGELISLTISLAVKHFGSLFILFGVLGAPAFLIQLIQVSQGISPFDTGSEKQLSAAVLPTTMALVLISWLLYPIQQGASILAISQSFTGRQMSLGGCLRAALRKFWSFVVFSILTGLLYFLGFFLLLIPTFIFLSWFYMGPAALLVEDLSGTEAMGRSRLLSKGRRLEVLGFAIVTGIIAYIPLAAVAFGAYLAFGKEPSYATAVVNYVGGIIGYMVLIVAPVVYYFDTRVAKEAFDVETLSSLVDAIAERGKPATA